MIIARHLNQTFLLPSIGSGGRGNPTQETIFIDRKKEIICYLKMKNYLICYPVCRSVFGGSYSYEIVMTTPEITFGPALLDALAAGLTPLTALGFMYSLSEITPELAQDVRKHVVPAERLRVAFGKKKEPIAFIASAVRETRAGRLYELEGIIVHPDQQGKHIGKKLLTDELKRTHASLLGFQTQNQRMVDLGASVATPDIRLASELAPIIGTPMPVIYRDGKGHEIVVHEKRYGGTSLYHNFDQFLRDGKNIPGLATSEGDALVFIGKVKEEICSSM